jgi:predicted NBD/HSP70 family sugar kinase
MCVEPNGLLCNCGKKGCLEAYCSTLRISTNIGITLDEFFEGIQKGNLNYKALWDDVLEHLAIGINNIHMALDCDVILGGILSQYLEPYMPELTWRIAEKDTFEDNTEYVKLCHYPCRADTMGVALHYINEYIENI